ncbi:MAG: NrdH-redoxin [Anaerolineales bacterium]|nr:MAG: NrdH-redoxin [Anaerolineales bacterium]
MNIESDTPAIVLYGTAWCPDVAFVRRYLDRHEIVYDYCDIDLDTQAMAAILAISGADWVVPTFVFPDSSVLCNPSIKALAEKLGNPKIKRGR